MKLEEVIDQLESLIDDRKSFLSDDGDDEIFRADIEALEYAVDKLKRDQKARQPKKSLRKIFLRKV